jgi:hypothetical protein
MAALHCYTATTITDILHSGQFVFAHMGCAHFRSSTETALGFVTTRIAKMSGGICNRATVLTRVCHIHFLSFRAVIKPQLNTLKDINSQYRAENTHSINIVKSGIKSATEFSGL